MQSSAILIILRITSDTKHVWVEYAKEAEDISFLQSWARMWRALSEGGETGLYIIEEVMMHDVFAVIHSLKRPVILHQIERDYILRELDSLFSLRK